MPPRNNDATTSYKKKNFQAEDNDDCDKNILPNLLHKKHKVVKLVKSQIQKIQEEGLICAAAGVELDDPEFGPTAMRLRQGSGEELDLNRKCPSLFSILLLLLLILLLLVILMVWISAGPLSNSSPHTPVLKGSFIQTEGLCSLEKKYLLRWSKPEYYE